jgi:hypothetical protein
VKRSQAYDYYFQRSSTLSTVTRQLCFAGIAVVWVFTSEQSHGPRQLPDALTLPLLGFVLALACDLCQYLIATISWGFFHRLQEWRDVPEDAEVEAPAYINLLPLVFFYSKVGFTLVSYIGVASFLYPTWLHVKW